MKYNTTQIKCNIDLIYSQFRYVTPPWYHLSQQSVFIRTCFNYIIAEKHVTQLQGLQVPEVDRLLGAVVDVENIFMSMHREDDHDTKRVYYYLFKVR